MSELPSSPTFTSSAFPTLSTFFATCRLVDLFHSTATSRVSLQGFLPLTQGQKLVAPTLPSRRFSQFAYKQLPTYSSSLCAALKALLRVRIRTFPTKAINLNRWPFPSWFSLLQVFTRSDVPVPSHLLPPCALPRVCRCHPRCWPLAIVASIGLSFPRLPTCSRFRTCSHPTVASVM